MWTPAIFPSHPDPERFASQHKWQKRTPEFSWEQHIDRMTEPEFKLRYRVGSDSFYKLLDKLRPSLEVDPIQAFKSRAGKPIAIEAVLACGLRYFAGGDPLDLRLIYCMSKVQVMICAWRVVDALNLHCSDGIACCGAADLQADLRSLHRPTRAAPARAAP